MSASSLVYRLSDVHVDTYIVYVRMYTIHVHVYISCQLVHFDVYNFDTKFYITLNYIFYNYSLLLTMAYVAYGTISLWLLSLMVLYHFGSQSLTVP